MWLFIGDGADHQGGRGVEKDPARARCSTGEVGDIFSPPMTSTPRQRQKASTFKTFSQDRSSNISQDAGSHFGKCNHCGFIGHFANHLRESQQCIQAYRTCPKFDVQGNDEEFIVRFSILTKNCPSPECPGGSHRQIPSQCLAWWIEFWLEKYKVEGSDCRLQ